MTEIKIFSQKKLLVKEIILFNIFYFLDNFVLLFIYLYIDTRIYLFQKKRDCFYIKINLIFFILIVF